MRQFYFFFGTTAELLKIAPVIKEFRKRNISYKLISSGQNKVSYEALDGYIDQLKPDISFNEKVNRSSVTHFLGWGVRTLFQGLISLKEEFKSVDRDNCYFIIHGDTASSSIGALIAKLYNLKLVHIESGDLSFNLFEPFPEEICRNININLANILFPPNDWAKNNLKKLNKPKISTGQNTLIDTFWWALNKKATSQHKLKKYFLLFMHRQEHVIFRKEWTQKTMATIIKNVDEDLDCVILNHPLSVQIINSLDLSTVKNVKSRIKIIPPLLYPDFLKLMQNAEFIATDGCSLQLETYLMGKPCLILRDLTEQIEGVNQNIVLSKGKEEVIKDFVQNYTKYKTKPIYPQKNPAKIIVDYLTSK